MPPQLETKNLLTFSEFKYIVNKKEFANISDDFMHGDSVLSVTRRICSFNPNERPSFSHKKYICFFGREPTNK